MGSSKFATVFGFISTIASIIGFICFFSNPSITLICAGTSLFNSFIQVVLGEQKNFTTEIITIFIAVIISFFADISTVMVIAVALCVADAALSIFGWILMLFAYKKF